MTAIRELKSTENLGWRGFVCALLVVSTAVFSVAKAQAPAASGNAPAPQTPEQLEKLVGPIALYPDDLVAIILPASTSPLQLVQADRFLEKRKADPKLAIDDKWDDAVKSLLNYPEVVKRMSADLDWTVDLGEAVVADQGAVLDAIQAFRRKTQAAGNLKTDDKQVVVVEKEIVKIVPANPEVIYVPQYNPSSVVVYSSAPVWGYYPAPYPSYYYPYAPGAAMAAGVIWGAAIGAAWSGNRYGWGGGNDININRNTNISTGGNTINRGGAGAGNSAWKSNKTPGQVASGTGRSQTGARVGDSQLGGGGRGGDSQFGGGGDRGSGAGGARASTQPAGGAGRGGGDGQFGGGGAGAGGARASTQPAGGGAGRGGGDGQFSGGGGRDSFGGGNAGGNSAFGGYGSSSGRQTQADSSRGAASRNSMSSGAGGGRSPSASTANRGGGGASAGRSAGGGGARGGGGGRGGGGRR